MKHHQINSGSRRKSSNTYDAHLLRFIPVNVMTGLKKKPSKTVAEESTRNLMFWHSLNAYRNQLKNF